MKFQLAINMERMNAGLDMTKVARHTLEMVQMADAGGFNVAWAAEHHALEMTIVPSRMRSVWAAHQVRIENGLGAMVISSA